MRRPDWLRGGRWTFEQSLWSPAACLAATAFLLLRLAPDVHGKPIHQDEALAGLISAQRFSVVVATVLVDRGGAPLHFVLRIDSAALSHSLEDNVEFRQYASWLLIRLRGPFSTKTSVIRAADAALEAAHASTTRRTLYLARFYANTHATLSGSLKVLRRECEACAR